MSKTLGYCGIACSDCPVLKATLEDNDAERRRIAETFTEQYRKEYRPDDINCDGCIRSSARLFSYCSLCGIRKCGMDRKVGNCASCSEYPCGKLSELFAAYSKAKENLDNVRHELGEAKSGPFRSLSSSLMGSPYSR